MAALSPASFARACSTALSVRAPGSLGLRGERSGSCAEGVAEQRRRGLDGTAVVNAHASARRLGDPLSDGLYAVLTRRDLGVLLRVLRLGRTAGAGLAGDGTDNLLGEEVAAVIFACRLMAGVAEARLALVGAAYEGTGLGVDGFSDRVLCTHSVLGILTGVPLVDRALLLDTAVFVDTALLVDKGLLAEGKLLIDGALLVDIGLLVEAELFDLLSRLRAVTSALLSSLNGRRNASSLPTSAALVRLSVFAGADAGLDTVCSTGVSARCTVRLGHACRLACVVSLAEDAVLPYH